MQRLFWGEKSNSDKAIYRGKFSLVQKAHTKFHSALKPPLNEILVCARCVVGVGTYLLWSKAKHRAVKGLQKANENKKKKKTRLFESFFACPEILC